MKTLKKIKNAIIETGKIIARKPLEITLATILSTSLSCCKNGKDPIYYNQPPAITTTAPTNSIENQLYSYNVNADDPNGDVLTYSLLDAPLYMTINGNTGLIEWTPTDDDASLYHNVTVKVDDGKDFVIQDFKIYAKNTSTIQIKVQDIFDDINLAGIKVDLGSHTDTTDINGVAEFNDIIEGLHPVEVRDGTGNENDYFTYKAGQYECRKGNELENTVLKVIPTTLEFGDNKQKVLNHIKNCIRTPYDEDFDIKKWGNKPILRIYKKEFSTGNPVPQEQIDLTKDIILNELYKVNPLFTDLIIQEIDTIRPIGPIQDGYIDRHWNDGISGARGGTSCNTNNFEITGGYVWTKTTQGRNVHLQELTEVIIGQGESNLYSSVLNDFNGTPPEPENYTTTDNKVWKIYQNRPTGNKDLENFNEHDVNLSDYKINP